MRWVVKGWQRTDDEKPECLMYMDEVLKLNALTGTLAEMGYQRIEITKLSAPAGVDAADSQR